MSSPTAAKEASTSQARRRQRALMKVVLFVCRVQRATTEMRKSSPKRVKSSTGSDRQNSVDELSNSSSASGIDLSLGGGTILRCRTVPSISVGGQRPSRSHIPTSALATLFDERDEANFDDSGASRASIFSSHLSLPISMGCRSRSSSAASNDSISPSHRPRASTDSPVASSPTRKWPAMTKRYADYTGVRKPYTITFAEAAKEKALFKSLSIRRSSYLREPKQSPGLTRCGTTNLKRCVPIERPGEEVSDLCKRESAVEKSLIRTTTLNDLKTHSTSDEAIYFAANSDLPQSDRLVLLTDFKKPAARQHSNELASADKAVRSNLTADTSSLVASNSACKLPNIIMNSKLEKRKTTQESKKKQSLRELLELFTAVEQDDIGKVRSLLQKADVDVNMENTDDLTMLDVAIMLNHAEVAHLLLKQGAQENPRLTSTHVRIRHLQSLVDDSQKKLAELQIMAKKSNPSIKDLDKQISSWESRLHMLKKMKTNFENLGYPSSPRNVCVQVISVNSLQVQFEPPELRNGGVITKYKIEWSFDPTFNPVIGSIMLRDLRRLEITLPTLETGSSYYLRVLAGNLKGFGPPAPSEVFAHMPSSWLDVDARQSRNKDKIELITTLNQEMQSFKQGFALEKLSVTGSDSPAKRKKSSFKNLFIASSRFQKNVKKGIYLCSLLYSGDKVLCTFEDTLPVIEVGEECPSSFIQDFNWFTKLSCSWDEVRSVLVDPELVQTASAQLIFRHKLAESAAEMQLALGVEDLGRLHHEPISDDHGATILTTVLHVPDPKSVQGLAVKWLPMTKILRKHLPLVGRQHSALDIVVSKLLDLLNFYESSQIPLDRGLYLCYLKLQSSFNQISVQTPENLPSVLPFVYIRDNPHVSREEWAWLKNFSAAKEDENDNSETAGPTHNQFAFHWAVASAARILCDDLDVDDPDSHRIFSSELIEVHPEVSFILLVPSTDQVCSAPGQNLNVVDGQKRGCFPLPVQTFETIHLCTYQPDFIALYSKISAILEMYALTLQQIVRQTVSASELRDFKQKAEAVTNLQLRLDEVWRQSHWITDVATVARDRSQLTCSAPLGRLLNYSSPNSGIAAANPALRTAGPDQQQRFRNNSQSDHAEDNSDVGYHSDQSIDKLCSDIVNGSTASSSQQLLQQVHQMHALVKSDSVAVNPVYECLPISKRPSGVTTARPDAALPDCINSSSDDCACQNKPPSFRRMNAHSSSNCSLKTREKLLELIEASSSFEEAYGSVMANGNGFRKPAALLTKGHSVPPPIGHSHSSSTLSVNSSTGSSASTHSQATVRSERCYFESSSAAASDVETTRSAPTPQVNLATNERHAAAMHSGLSDSELRMQGSRAQPFKHFRYRNQEDLSLIDRIYACSSTSASQLALSECASECTQAHRRVPPKINLERQKSTGNIESNSMEESNSVLTSLRLPVASARSKSTGEDYGQVLRIYAAYDCGLSRGTSVKLHMSSRTTAQEAVRIVVKQLRKAALSRNALPIPEELSEQTLGQFCLVAVIGSRERCLRDNFKPLDLQPPWSKGRLYIRRKLELLAALEFGNDAQV